MIRSPRQLHILDKDLDRLSAAEQAGSQSMRPLARVGLAVLFVAVVVVIAVAALPQATTGQVTVLAGVALAAYLALAIGANDVSNSLAPAVGARAIGIGTGLALVATAEIAGAVLAGRKVSATLSLGIVDPRQMLAGGSAAPVMLAALLAAAIWVNIATWAGAPVSTTHSVVGGIAGAGMAAFGATAVNWPGIAMIAGGWIVSPLASGALAAGLLALIRQKIDDAPERDRAARRWLSGMIGTMAALAAGILLGGHLGQQTAVTLGAMAGAGGAATLAARRHMARRFASAGEVRAKSRDLFGLPLVLVAVLMGFAHGANDSSNVTAPLWLILEASGEQGSAFAPGWIFLLAGGGLALGALLFGRRLVVVVGSRITRLNPVRAFCVSLATGTVVLAASWQGLPVSTTHVAVGGIFGVGFFREWDDARRHRRYKQLPVEETHRRTLVRRAHVRRILLAWAITLPASAALAALFSAAMQ
ncbi:inorganic phosphate transporter [Paracoccus sp. Z118]|uniref:inorganic phosphate transporter n=1 Tax=Paracoccus sp. Z118 TaxID=2851017 RepID=UPI001C2B995F|nr:inorganic phosphate transporter [Paracoccus sp. Z118]MBV0891846.1 inorganic phosphate transporter [Paracoccus sp. Z118]